MADFVDIDELEFARKSKVAALKSPYAVAARFDARRKRVIIVLDNGAEFSFVAASAFGLEASQADDLRAVEIDGAGSTLRFPKLNADFSVARLFEGFLGPMSWSKREARANASRANGKLGGRPRRVAGSAA